MGPKRTYGTKRSTVAAGSAMIFGSAVNSSDPVEELTVALADASIDEDSELQVLLKADSEYLLLIPC
jgi:hypothetical protein